MKNTLQHTCQPDGQAIWFAKLLHALAKVALPIVGPMRGPTNCSSSRRPPPSPRCGHELLWHQPLRRLPLWQPPSSRSAPAVFRGCTSRRPHPSRGQEGGRDGRGAGSERGRRGTDPRLSSSAWPSPHAPVTVRRPSVASPHLSVVIYRHLTHTWIRCRRGGRGRWEELVAVVEEEGSSMGGEKKGRKRKKKVIEANIRVPLP